MIIKSMARKAATFEQLISYMEKEAQADIPAFAQHVYAGVSPKALAAQFQANYAQLPKRKGGNALYHEIIALEPQPALTPDQTAEALLRLAEAYCAKRGPELMAWGRVHLDKQHPHIHLMLSSNAVAAKTRSRLSRKDFAEIQRDMDRLLARNLGYLRHTPLYDRPQQEKPKIKTQEGEAKRRTGRPNDKETLSVRLAGVFDRVCGRDAIDAGLAELGLQLYQRGQSFGVLCIADGRKHRLKTLGLKTAFAAALARKPPELKKLKRQPLPKPPPGPAKALDPRAAELLRRREQLEGFGREHLKDFNPERLNQERSR